MLSIFINQSGEIGIHAKLQKFRLEKNLNRGSIPLRKIKFNFYI
jgi:hypothetical protein